MISTIGSSQTRTCDNLGALLSPQRIKNKSRSLEVLIRLCIKIAFTSRELNSIRLIDLVSHLTTEMEQETNRRGFFQKLQLLLSSNLQNVKAF